MKKILLFLFLSAFIMPAWAQNNIQLTLKPGTSINKVKVVLRSNADVTGIISTVQISFRVPKAGLSTRPGAIITNNFMAGRINWVASTSDPSSPCFVGETATDYYYIFNGDITTGATAYSFINNNEVDFIEVAFTGSSLPVTISASQRTSGGALSANGGDFTSMDIEGSCNFFISIGGADRTNLPAQYYTGTSCTVSNSGLGYAGESAATFTPGLSLPINWLAFAAKKLNDDAILNWNVANEENNAFYEVERSVDGQNFTKIAQVQRAAGGAYNEYAFTDAGINRFNAPAIYYRLKQTDRDGQFSYSKVATLRLSVKEGFLLYPNPASFSTTLVVDAEQSGRGVIIITDAAGKQVQTLTQQWTKGINQKTIDVSNLPSGEYHVTITTVNQIQTLKLKKIN